ncbi:unnamed protein product [Sympodiomycopsis kandeliae]
MWVTIAGGGHLAIGTRNECRDISNLPSIWKDRGVTIVNAVPTMMGILAIAHSEDEKIALPDSLRLINLGGEACPPALVQRLARPGLRLVNSYGPSESESELSPDRRPPRTPTDDFSHLLFIATVTATIDELLPGEPVTIGRPLPSYHACLLPISEDGEAASTEPLQIEPHIEGELAIGGPCVGLGYVGRPEVTAQKFIKHPLAPMSSELLYKTGDRVRLSQDLKILFLGRIDTQVKHRGFRIELGEIESVLSDHHDVQAAAVILASPGTEQATLEAFVVTRPDCQNDALALKRLASERLPSYMCPEMVHFLSANEMPRLPSGKINGKLLHEISAQRALEAAENESSDDAGTAFSTEVDPDSVLGNFMENLKAIFPGARGIKPSDDFFNDLGGHSLLAAVLVSRLRQSTTKDGDIPFASIGLPDIYEGRTAKGITARFETYKGTSDSSSETFEDQDATGPRTGRHLPITNTRFVLCGLAQVVPILFLFFIRSVEILVPYLLFDFFTEKGYVGWAILATYGTFVAIPIALSLVAIAGKWVFLGRAKAGEYPLYGTYYFRWWLANRFVDLANNKLIADSPLHPHMLRRFGAKVGRNCHIGSLALDAALDLVNIGDDVVIGADVLLATSTVERGLLILKPVVIGSDAIIGSDSLIEGGAKVEEGGELAPLTMLPDGAIVPSFQRYHGSPARLEHEVKEGAGGLGKATRPSTVRSNAMIIGHLSILVFVLPLLYFAPQLPGLILFDLLELRQISEWGQVAVLSVPIALAYLLIVSMQLAAFRWLFFGRVKEGTYSIHTAWYLRKWFVERLMDLAIDILQPVFATLYIAPFLRLLGVKIGKRAEISNARGLQFELLEIGDESFIADSVMMGHVEIRGNQMKLEKTVMSARAFAGNKSLLPQGTKLANDTLVGVLSVAPPSDRPLTENTSCFGSPPVLMPARQRSQGHDESLLFKPSAGRVAARLLVEGLRIVLPRAIIIFGLGFALQIAYAGYNSIGAVYTLMLLPIFYFVMFAIPSLLFTVILKWLLVGRYSAAEWPLWSLDVWLSEAITSTWYTLTEPLLASILVGTPFLAWCLRLLGAQIGSRAVLLGSDITEYDCVSIGDEAMLNGHSGQQTHLFEDRVMKVGRVDVAARACAKSYSICLPGSSLSENAQIGSLSLLMKGESLPAGTAWEGAPVGQRSRRMRFIAGDKVTTLKDTSSTTLA